MYMVNNLHAMCAHEADAWNMWSREITALTLKITNDVASPLLSAFIKQEQIQRRLNNPSFKYNGGEISR